MLDVAAIFSEPLVVFFYTPYCSLWESSSPFQGDTEISLSDQAPEAAMLPCVQTYM